MNNPYKQESDTSFSSRRYANAQASQRKISNPDWVESAGAFKHSDIVENGESRVLAIAIAINLAK
ncbi:MAG TPA: hypothetical protein V6C84_12185 [Coleofasciculaceae cyanobacterium]